MSEPSGYRAFISYSHRDTAWAKWLHKSIERFQIDRALVGRQTSLGPIPTSLHPVFRDRNDFTAGHSLTEQTLAALDTSAALIVICSPNAAKSDYVAEEIRLFRSHWPDRPVLPVIVNGAPDSGENECFPESLKFELDDLGRPTNIRSELVAADPRESGDGKALALAKVVASLVGVGADEIFRRAERARRKRLAIGLMAAATLAIGFAGIAVWAEVNRQAAERRLNLAEATAMEHLITLATIRSAQSNESFIQSRTVLKGVSETPYQKMLQELLTTDAFVSIEGTPIEIEVLKAETLLRLAEEPGDLAVFGQQREWVFAAADLVDQIETREPLNAASKRLRAEIDRLAATLPNSTQGGFFPNAESATVIPDVHLGGRLRVGMPDKDITEGIAIGEAFSVELDAESNGVLALIDVQPDGNVRLVTVPDYWKSEKRISLVAQPPIGKGLLYFFLLDASGDNPEEIRGPLALAILARLITEHMTSAVSEIEPLSVLRYEILDSSDLTNDRRSP